MRTLSQKISAVHDAFAALVRTYNSNPGADVARDCAAWERFLQAHYDKVEPGRQLASSGPSLDEELVGLAIELNVILWLRALVALLIENSDRLGDLDGTVTEMGKYFAPFQLLIAKLPAPSAGHDAVDPVPIAPTPPELNDFLQALRAVDSTDDILPLLREELLSRTEKLDVEEWRDGVDLMAANDPETSLRGHDRAAERLHQAVDALNTALTRLVHC